MTVVARGATRVLAHWAAGVRSVDVPTETLHQARRILVDFVAAAVAGSTTELSKRIRSYLTIAGAGDQSTVIGGGRATAASAAFANGTAAHGLELDDGYTPGSVHPGAVTVSAVLAAAEVAESDPEDLLAAIAVGVEITARVAAAGHPATLSNGFHNTPVAGVFGAAAGSARLLGADPDVMANAFGIAGSHSGGLHEYHTSGSDVKRLHAGKGARDGLTAAQLASVGVTGPHTVLEGSQGYFAAFARGDWDEDALLGGLGTDWVCRRTYVKPYPCCRHLHGPIDAALALRNEHRLTVADITSVAVETFRIATRHDRTHATSLLEAQLSIPFAVATTLRGGEPDMTAFGPGAREDSEIVRLASATSVTLDPELDQAYPAARPARLTLTLRDGTTVARLVEQPLGEPDNPIDDGGLNAKFIRLVGPVLGAARAGGLLESLWEIGDLTETMACLGTWPRDRHQSPDVQRRIS